MYWINLTLLRWHHDCVTVAGLQPSRTSMRVVVMNRMEQEARTVAVKACPECAAGLLDRDKFCRWCGAQQPTAEACDTNYKAVSAESIEMWCLRLQRSRRIFGRTYIEGSRVRL